MNSKLNYKYYTALIYKHENESSYPARSLEVIFFHSVPISLPCGQIRERVNKAPKRHEAAGLVAFSRRYFTVKEEDKQEDYGIAQGGGRGTEVSKKQGLKVHTARMLSSRRSR